MSHACSRMHALTHVHGQKANANRQSHCIWSIDTSDNGRHNWLQLPPNRGTAITGDPKQILPAPEVASQGFADITNQAARSQHAPKVGIQTAIAAPPSASQASTIHSSNTLQPTPQQHLQAVTIGSSNSTPLLLCTAPSLHP